MTRFITAVLLGALSLTVTAQPVVQPDPESATLVLYRTFSTSNHAPDFHLNLLIRINGQKVCKLSDNRYIVYTVAPGLTTVQAKNRGFSVVFGSRDKLLLHTEANRVYYVRCDAPRAGLFDGLRLAEVPFDAQQARRTNMLPDRCMERIEARKNADFWVRSSGEGQ